MKKLIAPALLGLTLGGVVSMPAPVRATQQCYACYHWEYRCVGYQWQAYTAYDHCGCPYTAYRRVPVYRWVKVYGY